MRSKGGHVCPGGCVPSRACMAGGMCMARVWDALAKGGVCVAKGGAWHQVEACVAKEGHVWQREGMHGEGGNPWYSLCHLYELRSVNARAGTHPSLKYILD